MMYPIGNATMYPSAPLPSMNSGGNHNSMMMNGASTLPVWNTNNNNHSMVMPPNTGLSSSSTYVPFAVVVVIQQRTCGGRGRRKILSRSRMGLSDLPRRPMHPTNTKEEVAPFQKIVRDEMQRQNLPTHARTTETERERKAGYDECDTTQYPIISSLGTRVIMNVCLCEREIFSD